MWRVPVLFRGKDVVGRLEEDHSPQTTNQTFLVASKTVVFFRRRFEEVDALAVERTSFSSSLIWNGTSSESSRAQRISGPVVPGTL